MHAIASFLLFFMMQKLRGFCIISGPSPSGKAQHFDCCIRWFESNWPSYDFFGNLKERSDLMLLVFILSAICILVVVSLYACVYVGAQADKDFHKALEESPKAPKVSTRKMD